MPSYSTADIRNIVLVGHAGSGKTSLLEAMLVEAGVLHQKGLVESGTTVSDFTDEEKKTGYSIFSATAHCTYDQRMLNFIDTPGYSDFVGQSAMALSAIETAAVVISATAGIEPVSRRMMERSAEAGLARMIIVNKIDAENVRLEELVHNIRETFGKVCLPVNLPAKDRSAVIDCFANTEGEAEFSSVADAHQQIVDQVVEVDEDLMNTYLEQGEVAPEQLQSAMVRALAEGHLVPICFVSSRIHTNPQVSTGVKELMNVLAQFAPSPVDGVKRYFYKGNAPEAPLAYSADPSGHLLAHVYSVSIDSFSGRVSTFRVHQGRIDSASKVFVCNRNDGEVKKALKFGHMFKFQGKEHVDCAEAIAGDIVGVARIDEIRRDGVLHDNPAEEDVYIRTPTLPQPMYGLAVSTKERGDEQKISEALTRALEEDPSLKVVRDNVTHETVVYGIGELHLRMLLDRFRARYKLDLDTRTPKIAYRETIAAKAESHYRHKKQTGGAGQFGEVYMRVEPLPRGTGFEFVDAIVGGVIPNQFIPAVEKGVKQALDQGVLAGFPVQDVRVVLHDGKHHPVDSKEIAFITAGRKAFQLGFMDAKPQLLEPIVKIEVTVPQSNMGDINGDLSTRRGQIQDTEILPGNMVSIRAQAPLAELSNYQNQLKSMTGGQGSFTMEFSHYDPVPDLIAKQVLAQAGPRKEEEED